MTFSSIQLLEAQSLSSCSAPCRSGPQGSCPSKTLMSLPLLASPRPVPKSLQSKASGLPLLRKHDLWQGRQGTHPLSPIYDTKCQNTYSLILPTMPTVGCTGPLPGTGPPWKPAIRQRRHEES